MSGGQQWGHLSTGWPKLHFPPTVGEDLLRKEASCALPMQRGRASSVAEKAAPEQKTAGAEDGQVLVRTHWRLIHRASCVRILSHAGE